MSFYKGVCAWACTSVARQTCPRLWGLPPWWSPGEIWNIKVRSSWYLIEYKYPMILNVIVQMLIVAGGTHAGSKLKSTEVSIFSHSLGQLWCAITFDCDYHHPPHCHSWLKVLNYSDGEKVSWRSGSSSDQKHELMKHSENFDEQ